MISFSNLPLLPVLLWHNLRALITFKKRTEKLRSHSVPLCGTIYGRPKQKVRKWSHGSLIALAASVKVVLVAFFGGHWSSWCRGSEMHPRQKKVKKGAKHKHVDLAREPGLPVPTLNTVIGETRWQWLLWHWCKWISHRGVYVFRDALHGMDILCERIAKGDVSEKYRPLIFILQCGSPCLIISRK